MEKTAFKKLVGVVVIIMAGLLLVFAQIALAQNSDAEFEYEIEDGIKDVDIVYVDQQPEMTGLTETAANGLYIPHVLHNDEPAYRHESGNHWIYWDDVDTWELSDGLGGAEGTLLYSQTSPTVYGEYLEEGAGTDTGDLALTPYGGRSVLAPSISFEPNPFSNDPQSTIGILADDAPYTIATDDPDWVSIRVPTRVRAYNPTSDVALSVTIAPDLTDFTGFDDVVWRLNNTSTALNENYPIHNNTPDNGRLYVRPETGTLTTDDTNCNAAQVTLGSDSDFLYIDGEDPSEVESITLFTEAADVSYCRYDLQHVEMEQRVPGSIRVGRYVLDMVLTIT